MILRDLQAANQMSEEHRIRDRIEPMDHTGLLHLLVQVRCDRMALDLTVLPALVEEMATAMVIHYADSCATITKIVETSVDFILDTIMHIGVRIVLY